MGLATQLLLMQKPTTFIANKTNTNSENVFDIFYYHNNFTTTHFIHSMPTTYNNIFHKYKSCDTKPNHIKYTVNRSAHLLL